MHFIFIRLAIISVKELQSASLCICLHVCTGFGKRRRSLLTRIVFTFDWRKSDIVFHSQNMTVIRYSIQRGYTTSLGFISVIRSSVQRGYTTSLGFLYSLRYCLPYSAWKKKTIALFYHGAEM